MLAFLSCKYNIIISTKGALRRPLTYDDHPIPLQPTLFALQRPRRHDMTLEIPGRPQMNSEELKQKDRKTEQHEDRVT